MAADGLPSDHARPDHASGTRLHIPEDRRNDPAQRRDRTAHRVHGNVSITIPLLNPNKDATCTCNLRIAFFSEQMLNNRAAQMAIAMLATIPMVIIFLACQKFFIKGATAGAVKG